MKASEEQVTQLKEEVPKKEADKVSAAATNSTSTDEEKKVLVAKIEELDRMVAAKQA